MTTIDDTASDRAAAEDRSTVRLEAFGGSPDAAVVDLSGFYAGRHWSARTSGRPFSYRYTAVGDADVTLRRSQIAGSIRGLVPASDEYIVQWLTAGHGIPDVVHDRVPMVRDVPMLFPTAREFVFDYQDHDQRLVHMSRRLVHAVADELFHTGEVADLGLDHLRTLDPATVTHWRGSLALLSRALRVGGVEGLLWHTLTRGTAAAFLRMYPPTVVPLPPAVLLPRRARLRAAVEYVHEHVAEPLTVSDVARAAGLSVRATQEAFQRHLGMPPLRYVQHVRLERVRHELLQTDATTGSVQAVARVWGFAHLGRFSAAYRNAFGEYPRETLRR
ncbi:helix-turn-helix transcriptional regulator [Curtobacterium herbarum]|uniref:HTH araC/xylS-type domain-containing protein n=1 Tax=Curtobacterium herbarum TaxID=150122 RepID=A0ABP4K8Y1_9MICO|nr:AraC family transcriptional regulator [Curtobacterium herbarum]MBM7476881.1 AraC-like DNA-binding protein [Curtobacterium herbarum]MCS6545108.1 AraC family transcriptional regulator [Curtobacterium herbarum]